MSDWNLRSIGAVSALLLASTFGEVRAQDLPAKPPMEALFSISGQVVDALDGYYVLRSDGVRTNIRFRDWPADLPGGRAVLGIGDVVTATGWLGATSLTLDVVSVYVEDRNAYFTLSQTVDTADEGSAPIFLPSPGFGPADSSASFTGVISEIGDGELTLRAGELNVPVEMSSLSRNPFDDIGSQRLNIGDTIMIDGTVQRNSGGEIGLQAIRVTSIFVVEAVR